MDTDKFTINEKLRSIQLELKVPKTHYNEYSKFYYRSNDDIYEAVKPLTQDFDCVLTLNDEPILVSDRIYIKSTATLRDSSSSIFSDGYAREPLSQKGMSDCQVTGTASSFARKYALDALFLLDNIKDIDSQNNTTNPNNASTPASNPNPNPEITMILGIVEHNDIVGAQVEWNGLIARHWASLNEEIKDKLNQMINQQS